jgi:predicted MFS family arabinose efflux permease
MTVAFAQRHHHLDAVAGVEAVQSVGSAVGGLVYGAIHWRFSGRRQMLGLIGVLGVLVALAGTASSIWLLAIIVGVSGLLVSPTITMTYVVADEAAPAERRTGAGALVNSVYNAGTSLGSAGSGLLLGVCPLSLCFVLTALPAWLAAASGLATGRSQAVGDSSAPADDSALEQVVAE